MGESHTRANLSTNTGLFLQLYRRGKSHTADTPTNAGTNTSRVRLSLSELTTNTCATGPKSSRTDPTPRRNSPAYDSRNSLRETRVRATAVQPVDMPMVREQVRDFFTSFFGQLAHKTTKLDFRCHFLAIPRHIPPSPLLHR